MHAARFPVVGRAKSSRGFAAWRSYEISEGRDLGHYWTWALAEVDEKKQTSP